MLFGFSAKGVHQRKAKALKITIEMHLENQNIRNCIKTLSHVGSLYVENLIYKISEDVDILSQLHNLRMDLDCTKKCRHLQIFSKISVLLDRPRQSIDRHS
jgi:hypothetical protein